MNIVVNGTPTHAVESDTVADVISGLGRNRSGRGVAIAVNGEVVPRDEWPATLLHDGDRVEILRAVGGG